jgi:hypothetical protein
MKFDQRNHDSYKDACNLKNVLDYEKYLPTDTFWQNHTAKK